MRDAEDKRGGDNCVRSTASCWTRNLTWNRAGGSPGPRLWAPSCLLPSFPHFRLPGFLPSSPLLSCIPAYYMLHLSPCAITSPLVNIKGKAAGLGDADGNDTMTHQGMFSFLPLRQLSPQKNPGAFSVRDQLVISPFMVTENSLCF